MQLDGTLELPFLTPEIPGVGGRLRARGDHFVVDEVPLYHPVDEGQHLYLNLTKEGLTTQEVTRGLAQTFGVAPRAIGFAGMKDKHARTTQSFSIPIGHVATSFPDEAAKQVSESLPVEVNWARLHRNKLRRGHLLGNRFQIRLTDPSDAIDEALKKCHLIGDRIRERGLANFYGPQRFGFKYENVRRGLAILKGDRSIRQRWLRSLLLASVQSYLCNLYLAERIESETFHSILLGDIAKKYDTGGLFVVEDVETEQVRFDNKEISHTAPIFGPKMREASESAGEREAALLEQSGISHQTMVKARMAGSRRLGRLLVPDLEISAEENTLVFSFFLPKGAFATTVMREFMKVDYETLAAFSVEEGAG